MSTSPWEKEPDTGRYYYISQDSSGRPFRCYEDESGASANRSRSNRRHQEVPRSGRRRRESPDGRGEEPGPTQPIAISRSSTTYHNDGGYGKSRDDKAYKRGNEYGSPSNPRGFEKSEGNFGAAEYYEDSEPRRRRKGSVDDPLPSMGNLTLDEVIGSPRYAVSSSAPVQPSQWASRSGEHDGTSTVIYEETTGHNEVTQTTVEYGDPYEDKGKGVARDAPTSYPSGNDAPRHISGTAGDSEPLDPSYKVRRYDYSKFFRQGRVFSTLWTDPWSNLTNESENNQFTSVVSYPVAHNERVHSKIRRFVVVKFGNRCCTCLPVTTYNRRGYQKGGIDLNEHGLIYSDNRAPDTIRGIKKQPLKVNLSRGGERLINPSYINYGRVYTVETNVKVKDVGELDSDSRKLLRKYWNECQTFPEDDEGPGSAQSPRGRAADLAGVGSGVTGSPQTYSGGPTSTVGPFPPSTMSGTMDYRSSAGGHPGYSSGGWHSAGSFPATSQHSYVAPTYNSQIGPSYGGGAANINYTATPQYDMQQGPSSSGYPPPIDNRYEQSSLAGAGHDLPSSSYTAQAPQVYPSSANPSPTATQFSSYGHSVAPVADDRYPHSDYHGQQQHSSAVQAPSDGRYPYARSSFEGGQYSSADASAWSSSAAQGSYNRAQDDEYATYEEDDASLALPTLEEVQASRHSRHGSVSGGSRSHTTREREGHGRRRRR